MGRKALDRSGGLTAGMLEVFGPGGPWVLREGPEYREEMAALPRLYKKLEQRKEAQRTLAKSRVTYMFIPCGRGRAAFGPGSVYVHGRGRCAYTGKGVRILRELLEVSGVTPHQVGQEEFTVTFPPSAMPAVAAAVKARRKRGRGASRARSDSSGANAVGEAS